MEMINLIASSLANHHKISRNSSKSDLCIDFVLVHNEDHREKREFFEKCLEEVGFIIRKEIYQTVNFVLIHAPKDVLIQYAEILNMKLPIKHNFPEKENMNFVESLLRKAFKYFRIELDAQKFPTKKNMLSVAFAKDKDYLFDIGANNFFCPSIRTEIVSYILHREKFSHEEQDQGIRKLLNDGVYTAAYPLHEETQRKLLQDEWATLSNCFKFQPIDNIKEYFGVEIGFYFSWLGFYTNMLIPASIVGLICFVYGLSTLPKDTLVKEICNSSAIMCPLCDKNCDYWKLSDTCTYSKVVHIIDNSATIFFAIFMSFWATVYLELWKRYSAAVTHKWGLTDFGSQCEPPRPEYLKKLATKKKITGEVEPYVPFWTVRLPSICLSFSIAIFWVLLAVAVIFGIVIYRMTLLASNNLYGDTLGYWEYVLPCTSAILNLLCISVLKFVYNYLAEMLTELELRRTQTEFNDSLTLKMYMFQFVNYYSCIFYIAFFKGKFVGYPLEYNRVFGFRQEECIAGGCLVELTIQLCIIMIGKQAVNSFMEMLIPFLYKIYNSFKQSAGCSTTDSEGTIINSCNQWTEDYKLSDMQSQGLFFEYLEMVVQYGFVLIFVTAFPLGPLFALLNNIFELRLDAQKLLKYFRRPVPRRVRDIGIWLPIMDFIGRIAVISNAFIIAFSSHFVPQLVYYFQNDRKNMYGYLNFTLSHFNVKHFYGDMEPETSNYNVSTCCYMDFRYPPTHDEKYQKSTIYWNVLAARLAFVVVYQIFVGGIIYIVQWIIPDTSKKLNIRIKTGNYRTNEIIIKHETERARNRKIQGYSSHLNYDDDSNEVHRDETYGI